MSTIALKTTCFIRTHSPLGKANTMNYSKTLSDHSLALYKRFKESHRALTDYDSLHDAGLLTCVLGYKLGDLRALHVYEGGLHIHELNPERAPKSSRGIPFIECFGCEVMNDSRTAQLGRNWNRCCLISGYRKCSTPCLGWINSRGPDGIRRISTMTRESGCFHGMTPMESTRI